MGFGTPDEIGDFVPKLRVEIFDQIGFGRFLHRSFVAKNLLIAGMTVGVDDGRVGQLTIEAKKRAAALFFAQLIKVKLSSRGSDRQCGPDVVASPLFADVRIELIDDQIAKKQFRLF